MPEATGPAIRALTRGQHLLQPLIQRVERSPDQAMAAYREGNSFVDVAARDFYRRVRRLAKGLIASGIGAGDRVALMSATRFEWSLLDYAILAAGAITVPVYETSAAEQVAWIVSNSGTKLLIVETPAMRQLAEAAGQAPSCQEIVVIDEGLRSLENRGRDVDDAVVDERTAGIDVDQVATIVYTSGTTGRPKGCAITHSNLRLNAMQNVDAVGPMLGNDEVLLLFLPMAHTLSKMVALVGMEWGAKLVFSSGISHLAEELQLAKPTMVVAVPRVFEKVYNGAEHKAKADGKGSIFAHAADTAIQWSQNHASGHRGLLTAVEHVTFDPLVYRKLRAAFGGNLRFAFSGGGPLGERLTHFYNGIGVKIFEGYGLTETSPTLTINRSNAWKPGTVGRPLAGTTIRIADDGEILAKGPQVFTGYWHNEEATAETFDADGWFRTGDIGELDDEGFLRITGRKKEIIVTAAGKNVAPAPLEDRLRAHPLISQAVVVGDNRPFVAVLIALDEQAIEQWAGEHGLQAATVDELLQRTDLRTTIQEAVDQANKSVSRAESIRKFAILPRDLTIEAGELTPTLKVRRSMVEKAYAATIDQLYRSDR
ncbi:MAG: long-chain fatty acid--CoA ligase [Actinomycetota bacterium]|nr:long-chain fatty acid--CoA ligase [Actinomycetota bacterium]